MGWGVHIGDQPRPRHISPARALQCQCLQFGCDCSKVGRSVEAFLVLRVHCTVLRAQCWHSSCASHSAKPQPTGMAKAYVASSSSLLHRRGYLLDQSILTGLSWGSAGTECALQ